MAQEDHLKFLNQRYRLKDIANEGACFTPDELDLLHKYGTWLNALMIGKIKPTTDEQKRFVKVCQKKHKPVSKFEKVWLKYLRIRNKHHVKSEFKRIARQIENEPYEDDEPPSFDPSTDWTRSFNDYDPNYWEQYFDQNEE